MPRNERDKFYHASQDDPPGDDPEDVAEYREEQIEKELAAESSTWNGGTPSLPAATPRTVSPSYGRIGPNQIGRLIRDDLESPDRERPLLVISVVRGTQRYLVDPSLAAERLGASAEVVALLDGEAGWELSQRIGGPRSCYWGAVRLYWPGFTRESRASAHPVWFSRRIEQLGPERVLDDVRERIESRLSPPVAPEVRPEAKTDLTAQSAQVAELEAALASERTAVEAERSAREAADARVRDVTARVWKLNGLVAALYEEPPPAFTIHTLADGERPQSLRQALLEEYKCLYEQAFDARIRADIASRERDGAVDALEGISSDANRLARKLDEAHSERDRVVSERDRLLRELGRVKEDAVTLRAQLAKAQSDGVPNAGGSIAVEQREELERHAENLELHLTEVQEELDRISEERDQLRHALAARGQPMADADQPDDEPVINSVLDALNAAHENESLRSLQILSSAFDSARKSPSTRGPDLHKALLALDRLAVEHSDGLGKGVRDWLRDQLPDVPFDYASDISDTTAGKREHAYTFGGILMGKHLKFGNHGINLLRVHFEFEFPDEPQPRCVVGWAGDHLPDEHS